MSVDSIEAVNDTKQNLEILSKVATNNGWTMTIVGAILLAGGPILMSLVIAYEKVKTKAKIGKCGLSVLFDEMYDGKDIELEEKGYDAYSVKKLRLTGEPLQYDYSVLQYVKENKMILVTEDPENYGGCQENNLPCIKLGQNPSIEEIVKALESLKSGHDSVSNSEN